MRSQEDRDEVRHLLESGMSRAAISRQTGIPYNTVTNWARGRIAAFGPTPERERWRPNHASTYAYLLGIYLGDGSLSVRGGTSLFRVVLDNAYPEIIEGVLASMVLLSWGAPAYAYPHKEANCTSLQSSGWWWLDAFPQHGPGRKHTRAIVLEPWQQAIVDAHPAEFVRGLIHSDGCRTVNRFKTTLPSGRVAEYECPRYFFSNVSADIRGLFRDACTALGVRTSVSGRNVSVSDRASVRRLDELVGPKR